MSAGAELRWSSRVAFYLGAAGAAVGLGSIWRFPYLAGSSGGSAFILVFVIACLLIATPLLAAEFAIGRGARVSPPAAAGAIAARVGGGRRWNAIGVMGALSSFVVSSYYMLIAGWVLAYTFKAGVGMLSSAGPDGTQAIWDDFLADPVEMALWHLAFVVGVAVITSRGLQRGIEVANKIRAPGLLILLLILVAYALITGDVRQGLAFAFRPDFSAIDSDVVLAAIGQAFYATGVGQAMMIAYGAYVPRGTSLLKTSGIVTGSILLVSLLATLMIFPLVFGYGMDPAQGSQLVFEVLPRAFAEMPGGRVVGTLFFLLLVLAALMPSVGSVEPTVAWAHERFRASRQRTTLIVLTASWLLGIGSVLSFNLLADWHPLGAIALFEGKTLFDTLDYFAANVMMPLGALLTSLLLGWRVRQAYVEELEEATPWARRAAVWLLRWLCPIAIFAVLLMTGLP